MATDVQTPFLRTPLAPLKRKRTLDAHFRFAALSALAARPVSNKAAQENADFRNILYYTIL